MIASRVHAIMAAGLENPDLLARWNERPELLRSYGVDPAAFDLGAIRKFAGLSAKVRHNGLRSYLPLTFRFLSLNGLEIEIFADYALHQAREGKPYAATTEERIVELVHFLSGWLDLNKPEQSLVWDLVRHETALAQLRNLTKSAKKSRSRKVPGAASVPHVAGQIFLHEMNSDPRQLGRLLRQQSINVGDVRQGVVRLGYWNPGDPDEVCILELDELGYHLLSVVDGRKTVADFSRLFKGKSKPTKNLIRAFSQLATVGVIYFNQTAA
jgi:hypothetical protein